MRHPAIYVLVAIMACCAAVTACASSPRPTAATPRPSSSAPPAADDRLAIATSRGVVIWSANSGVRQAGPPIAAGQGVQVSMLTWSSDGRHLAWLQESKTSEANDELVSVDTKTGASSKWPLQGPPGGITFDGSAPVTIDRGNTFLRVHRPGGVSSQVLLPSMPDVAGSLDDGFVFFGYQTGNASVTVRRADFTGRVSAVGQLPGPGMYSPYEMASAAGNGKELAVEKGDHQDVCGLGPSSRLYLLNTSTGTGTWTSLPVPSKTTWRFANMTFGADNPTLDLTAYNVTKCGGTFPTTLFELRSGRLTAIERDVLQGQRGPADQLAVVTGDDAYTLVNYNPSLTVTGNHHVIIDGEEIALSATPVAIAWAPEN